jgi:hypothetical protein
MPNQLKNLHDTTEKGADFLPSAAYKDIFSDVEEGRRSFTEGIEGQNPVHWSVPWSDLMMVMFVFFAILFYCKKAESVPHNKVVPEQQVVSMQQHEDPFIKEPHFGFVSPHKILESSKMVVKEADLDNVEVVLQDDQSVKVSVLGPYGRLSGQYRTLSQ